MNGRRFLQRQRGVTLIVALVFLVALTLVALSASYSSVQEERFARNGRDFTLATEAAESALRYGEGLLSTGKVADRDGFIDCTVAGNTASGLCLPSASGPMHVLLNSNLSNASDTVTAPIASSSWSVPYSVMMTPRYVIEVFPDGTAGVDLTAQTGDQSYLYRITGRGFGLNQQINVTLESIFRPYG